MASRRCSSEVAPQRRLEGHTKVMQPPHLASFTHSEPEECSAKVIRGRRFSHPVHGGGQRDAADTTSGRGLRLTPAHDTAQFEQSVVRSEMARVRQSPANSRTAKPCPTGIGDGEGS